MRRFTPIVRPTSTRKTIALFSSSPGGLLSYEKWLLWRGVADAAKEYGYNLIYIAGEEFEASPQALLYELIGTNNVHGIITWHSFVSPRSGFQDYQEFIDQYLPLPIVSIEAEMTQTSNLLIDNKKGMIDLLDHLIETHHYQKIAYIGQNSNSTSLERQHAFMEYLQEKKLYDPSLVGELNELDSRDVKAGIDYQAVIVQSDLEAIEVVDILKSRGIRMPQDVAVAGFNDGREARSCQPALTTIRIPFRDMGRQAVEMLVNKLNGDKSLQSVRVPLHLVLRRSCGCLEPMAERAGVGKRQITTEKQNDFTPAQRQTILNTITREMGTSIEPLARSWAEQLIDIFLSEVKRHQAEPANTVPSITYLEDFSMLLQQSVDEGSNVSRWHNAVTTIRSELMQHIEDSFREFAEDMFQQARVLVGQAAVRAEVYRWWQTTRRAEFFLEFEAALFNISSLTQLLDVLAEGIIRIGFKDFYLVNFESQFNPTGKVKLAMAIQNGERLELNEDNYSFTLSQLLPEKMLLSSEPHCLVIESLHQGNDHLGLAVFKSPPPLDATFCDMYEVLRLQLSHALIGVKLRQEVNDALKKAEESNQLKSQFLSMVSHELRTPLNLIVGLSEMAIRQQNKGEASDNSTVSDYLEQIFISGRHLDRLIRDVLDLASSQVGKMQLTYESFDPLPVIDDAACMADQLARQKNLEFKAELPENLPNILGDKTRLRQILLNLLSNAVKFTAKGEVVLTVFVQNDLIHFSVCDTGLGIPIEEQENIFDEFYQSNRSSTRGYGGIGLGLAITRLLVEHHGGKIGVTSNGEEGGGSNFSFTIPVFSNSKFHSPHSDDNGSTSVRILTKTSSQASAVRQHLEDLAFSVEIIEIDDDGKYLDGLLSHPPGAVVLDLEPDSKTGWQIVKQIKEFPVTNEIPVIFYSLLDDFDRGNAVEMDYLNKPVGMDQMESALHRHGLKDEGNGKEPLILIVDDDPSVIDLHTRMVKSQLPRSQIIPASNGKLGIDKMREHKPDLVLLDLMMPELDGFEVLNIMQEELVLRNIPVIVLSGQSLSDKEMIKLNRSVASVMGKGLFKKDEVLNRISYVLSNNKRLGTESQRLVQRAMAFIHENYKSPISRSDMADHLCINEQYLSRCFKNEVGVGPITYLSRFRIEKAKTLLDEGTLSITQVAMEIGLSSQSYFSRLFQQETGLTPSAYRRGERIDS